MLYTYKGFKIVQSSKPGFFIYTGNGPFECLHANTLEDAYHVIDFLIGE